MGRVVEITELALRDAHQSLLATRMALEDMVPACEDLDNAGFWSIECWGGATFDACIRFLNEDPWERLRTFRKLLPKSRLQMLLRGQNFLGYRHYEDGVVERFVAKAAENGMDVFRVFDALNDLRNLTPAFARSRRPANTRKEPSATPSARCTLSPRSSRWRSASRRWARTPYASRIWRAAEASGRVRPRQRHQGEMWQGHARSCPCPCDHRRHDGLDDEGSRGRMRHGRYRGQLRCRSGRDIIPPKVSSRCSRAAASRLASTWSGFCG